MFALKNFHRNQLLEQPYMQTNSFYQEVYELFLKTTNIAVCFTSVKNEFKIRCTNFKPA